MQIFSEDFKYLMPDSTRLSVGASYTFGELLTMENTSFKLKMVIRNHILKEGDEATLRDMTVAEYMAALDEKSFTYQVLKQLKLRVKGSIVLPEGKNKAFHVHIEKWMPLRDKMNIPGNGDFFIEEINISKLALMGIPL